MRRFIVVASALCAMVFSASAWAAEDTSGSALLGRATAPEVLSALEKEGTKLTYLGNDGGLEGYLGENRYGKMQVFYVTPDGKHMIAGLLFRADGTNITGVQIGRMKMRAEHGGPQASGTVSPNSDFLSRLQKDGFVESAEKTAWFAIGDDKAPAVYIVVDPQCPYCHQAWTALKPRIADGSLSLRIIMTSILPESDEKAISILGQKSPGAAWLRGEGSSDVVPVSVVTSPDDRARGEHALKVNRDFANSINVNGTPFIAYVGDDGRLYSVDGLPQDMEGFFQRLPKK